MHCRWIALRFLLGGWEGTWEMWVFVLTLHGGGLWERQSHLHGAIFIVFCFKFVGYGGGKVG